MEDYLGAPDAYDNPVLRVYLDKDRMEYRAEVDDEKPVDEDNGYYDISGLVRDGDKGPEPDNDRASEIANNWIFLDWKRVEFDSLNKH